MRNLEDKNLQEMMASGGQVLQQLIQQQQHTWQLLKTHELFPGLADTTGKYPGDDFGRGLTFPSSPSSSWFAWDNDFFVGHIPEGELKEITVSFRKKLTGFANYTTGAYSPSLEYSEENKLELMYVYPVDADRQISGDVREEADEVIAKVEIIPGQDPLDFEPAVYHFNVDGGQITKPGSALYLRVRSYGKNSSNYFLTNVERVLVTGLFGAFDFGNSGGLS